MTETTALVLPSGVRWTGTGLEIPDGISREEWRRTGAALSEMAAGIQWAVGTWINAGRHTEGDYTERETLDEAEQIFPQFKRKTLQQYAWVVRESSMRIEDLSFQHHEVVASMGGPNQERWLTAASANGWTVGQLRKQIKGQQEDERECCPTCGRPLPKSKED